MRVLATVVGAMWLSILPARAQDSVRLERLLGVPVRQKPAPPLPQAQGLADHVVDGKLTLSLDDAIRLALANDTDIKLGHTQIDFAMNGLHGSYQRFDPLFTSSFNDQRATSPSSTQLQGAPVVNTLTQLTQFNYAQFLAAHGNINEARQWIQRILNKKATMPRYLKRRERPWFRRATALLKKLPAEQPVLAGNRPTVAG